MIAGCCHKVDEMCTPLGYYAEYSGNSLPTFWDSVSVPYSRVMNPRRPVTQVGGMPHSSTEWVHSHPTFQFYLFINFCFCSVFIVAFYFVYTGCHRRNGPNFGRVFLMLNYTDITQNTYMQIWTVMEIMAREVWKFDSCYTLTDCQIHIETGRNMWFL